MSVDNYSIKEVIGQRFDELSDHLIEIKTEVKKTNGRVTVLENHKAYLWGAFTALTFLGATIIAFAVQAIDNKIEDSLKKTISEVSGVELNSK